MRNLKKLVRDALVIGVGAGAYYVANNVASLGLPSEIAPAVAVIALFIYRHLRDTDTPIGTFLDTRDPS